MPEYEDVYEAPMLDETGQDVAAAIRELKGVVQPTNVCIDLDVSLEVSGWSNSAPYVYNWMNNKVTTECAVKVNYLEGAEDTDELYIGYEKIVGGIQFESPTKPTAAIPVRIHIVNAEADSITNIHDEMVSSNVISGAANVKQALTSLKNADATLSEQIGTLNEQITGKLFQKKEVGTVSANSSKTYTMTSNDHVALVFANSGDGNVGVWAISFRTSDEIGVSKLSTLDAYSSISTSGMTFTVSCTYLTKVKVVMF